MTDDSTEDTSNVTTSKANPRLLHPTALLLRLAGHPIKLFDRLFERRKLGHGVGDLARPQRIQSLVQATHALFGHNLTPSLSQVLRIRRQGGLHPHLDCFPWTKGHIGEELRRGTGAQEHNRTVHVGKQVVPVQVFEVFIEPVLASALERITDERWGPSEKDAAQAFFGVNGAPGREIGRIDLGVNLTTTLDEIQRGDGGVRWSCFEYLVRS